MQACKITTVPNGYREIFCDTNALGDRAFVCKNGYKIE